MTKTCETNNHTFEIQFHYKAWDKKSQLLFFRVIYSTERWTKFNRAVTMNSSNGLAEKPSTWLWVWGGWR